MTKRKRDEIAIVGMACRLPGGATTGEELWQLCANAKDAITTAHPDRWSPDRYFHPNPKTPGMSYTFAAGQVDDIDRFDAAFFGIPPREAAQIDPQQRLLLEMAWEALEDTGKTPSALAGTNCAVFMGVSSTDYASARSGDAASGDGYFMTGGVLSIAANRVSHFFDLRGPSMVIDTACSSSLVAVHQACRSLITGEAGSAVVGGVQVLLSPYPFVGFSKASMLSPDGRCRAFDANGRGYVRADGGAVLILKPLKQAIADADRIHAVIAHTGINSDGYTNTLAVPNANAQEALLRAVYAEAGIRPERVDYVEAHGTGTAVGDPIEATAIGRVFGPARKPGNPLPIGSVKTNIGHLEPASGVAGLVKVIQCLKHRALPPSLHFETPNPNIPFDDLNIRVVTQLEKLRPRSSRPLIMGVNSFGFGGTNAHAILREPPAAKRPKKTPTATVGCPPLLFSAGSEQGVKDMAESVLAILPEKPEPQEYYAVAHALQARRQEHEHRLAVIDISPAGTREKLQAFCEGATRRGVATGHAPRTSPVPVAFVFSGNGCQWLGMGRALLESEPIFRNEVDRVDGIFAPLAGFSIRDELFADAEGSRLDLTEVAQPALFAVQAGVLAVLRARGLEAHAALGHSVGEIAAAFAAGLISLEQAVRVIHARSAAQGKTRGMGKMAAVGLSVERVLDELKDMGCEATVAAINSPSSVTLAGSREELERLGARAHEAGFLFKKLEIEYAFHSSAMDTIRGEILESLADLKPIQRPGDAPIFVSTVTGERAQAESLDADYWWRNIREPVQLQKALETIIADGCRVFIEVGPHAIMQSYLVETLRSTSESSGRALPTLKRNDDGLEALLDTCATAQVHGCELQQSRLFPHPAGHVDLPPYPWQKQRHWFSKTRESFDLITARREHPLLGYPLAHVSGIWEVELDAERIAYLADHVVGGNILFPATGFLEMALAAGRAAFNSPQLRVFDLEIRKPLAFEAGELKVVQFVLTEEDKTFRIQSRTRLLDQPWTVHAVGRLGETVCARGPSWSDREGLAHAPVRSVGETNHFGLAAKLGLEYGPCFRGLAATAVSADAAMGELGIPDGIAPEFDKYLLHPALADSCLQTLLAILRTHRTEPTVMVPISIGCTEWYDVSGPAARCRARLVGRGERSAVLDLMIEDSEGQVIATLKECRFRAIDLSRTHKNHLMALQQTRVLMPRHGRFQRTPMPATSSLLEAMRPAVRRYAETLGGISYEQEIEPLFDALASAIAFRTIRDLGSDAGSSLSVESICHSAGVNRCFSALLAYLCTILEEDGLLLRDGPVWTWVAQAEFEQPEDIWRAIIADRPALLPEVLPAVRISQQLAGHLRGSQDCDHTNLEQLRSATRGRLFDSSPFFRPLAVAVRSLISDIVATWPDDRYLRIAEIYAGGAAIASEFARESTCRHFEYVVVAVNDDAEQRARTEYADIVSRVVRWTPDEPEETDSSAPFGSFDIVIASDTFDAENEHARTPRYLRSLLAAEGLFILQHRRRQRLTDIVFGTQANWWRTSPDHSKPASRQLTAVDWHSRLSRLGFSDITVLPEPKQEAVTPAYVILGRNAVTVETSSTPTPPAQSILILADRNGPSAQLANHLKNALALQSGTVIVGLVGAGETSDQDDQLVIEPECFAAALRKLEEADAAVSELVFLCGLTLDHVPEGQQLLRGIRDRCVLATQLVRGLKDAALARHPRLWLVTTGAMSGHVPGEAVNPAEAPLWGFGRVLANEWPQFDCRRVDLDPAMALHQLAAPLADEIMDPDREDEIGLTAQGRYATRVVGTTPSDSAGARQKPEKHQAVRLHIDFPGALHHLAWKANTRSTPDRDEVEIRVHAAGLNFRDVMYSIGMLPDEAIENGFAGSSLGLECAGQVVAIGPGVTEFAVGDSVLGFARSCFSSHVTTSSTAVVKMPALWTYEQAATVPSAFFTVYYALAHLARLQPEDRVLIHGAAGGVGLAAIQYAHHQGAEIFATAGTEEKRDFLRGLGVEHVHDSRSLAYADEILATTGGEGVDVVLNSLAGESVTRSLSILRPFGRFLELGKRDYFENNKIGLRPFRKNVSYFGIDADQLLRDREPLAKRLFAEVMNLFEKGAFRPLPHYIYSARRVVDAFRFMQQSRQIGKVVVSMEARPPVQRPTGIGIAGTLALRQDASYLVTGGLGGFGAATAEWLVEKGARHLVLVGRSGAETQHAKSVLERLGGLGAEVHVVKADVGDEIAFGRAMDDISRSMPALRGVIHSAMVLDDCLIDQLDEERFERVLAPKILGAWHLHQFTKNLPLDFFVMYSSASELFGNPGQANYVAANAFLEALARYRRGIDLPALAVGWGVIEDVGFMARHKDLREFVRSRFGNRGIPSRTALSALEDLLLSRRSGLAVVDLDLSALKRGWRGRIAPRYGELLAGVPDESASLQNVEDFRSLINEMRDDEALEVLNGLLVNEIGLILQMPAAQIDTAKSIADIGVDSLMATELAAAIEERLEVDIPLILATDGVTVADLSEKILQQLRHGSGPQEDDITNTLRRHVTDAASRHSAELTEQQVEELVKTLSEEPSTKEPVRLTS